jgi:proline iminopeptidase
MTEKINRLSVEQRVQNDTTGAPAYPPAMLLTVVLFADSRGIVRSRSIERMCPAPSLAWRPRSGRPARSQKWPESHDAPTGQGWSGERAGRKIHAMRLKILIRSVAAALLIGLAVTGLAEAQSLFPPPVPYRDSIVARIRDLRKISTPEGIDTLQRLTIDGSRQWISIRGLNRHNPILLVIHGGPGAAMMGSAWAYQGPWEDYFTVVNWDQRGVGKNHRDADTTALAPTMSMDRMVTDAEAVVALLLAQFGREKIVLMGFSFGTEIGLRLIKRRPEWVSAYVGVGQVAAGDIETPLYRRVMEIARQRGDDSTLKALQALAPYPSVGGPTPLQHIIAVRRAARLYNGGWYGRPDFRLWFSLPDWAPEYTAREVEAYMRGVRWGGEQLAAKAVLLNLSDIGRDFTVPIIVLQGRYDLHTPYASARDYVATLRAPHKRFITFERSAHYPMFEEPGRFLVTLVQEVLPLTSERAVFRVLP